MGSDRILRVWKGQPGCSVETDLEADSCIHQTGLNQGVFIKKGLVGEFQQGNEFKVVWNSK